MMTLVAQGGRGPSSTDFTIRYGQVEPFLYISASNLLISYARYIPGDDGCAYMEYRRVP